MNDLMVMSLSLLMLSLMVVILIGLILYQASKNQRLLREQLKDERIQSQQLLNQLRSQDLPSLHSLNQATLSPHHSASDEYVPSYDEQLQYEYNLRNSDFAEGNIDNDLIASGWSAPVEYAESPYADTRTSGNPVVF